MSLFNIILDWSEVWALLIPLTFILIYRPRQAAIRPLVIYVFIGLVLNGFSTTSYFFHSHMPPFLKNNNVFYNLHSFARVIFFGWYLVNIVPGRLRRLFETALYVYTVFVFVNFMFFQNLLNFSTMHFAAESIVLLFLCIAYFLYSISDETRPDWLKQPSFLVCTGIVIYEAITFSIFLFILPLATKNPGFGLLSLKIYKLTFVLLCCLITMAMYRTKKTAIET